MYLKDILSNHRLPFGFIIVLILMEALLTILFPLFIGFAIDGILNGSYSSTFNLALLAFAILSIGVGRKLFDSRFYSKIYQEFGTKVVSQQTNQDTSKKSARLSMMKELVEFLEISFPELINTIISLIGVIAIIAQLNTDVFWGTIITSMFILCIYWITSKKTLLLNKASNEEQEKQVMVITNNDEIAIKNHLKKMMRWNVKLSDLEVLNFSLTWLIMISFLVVSIMVSVNGGLVKYGTLFSLIMYVFQYSENVINLPFFYQNLLRLKEISNRLQIV